MFSADQIADIQGFNKVYQNLMKQMDSAILEAGYTLTEKDVFHPNRIEYNRLCYHW